MSDTIHRTVIALFMWSGLCALIGYCAGYVAARIKDELP